jgi:hypothetical protein
LRDFGGKAPRGGLIPVFIVSGGKAFKKNHPKFQSALTVPNRFGRRSPVENGNYQFFSAAGFNGFPDLFSRTRSVEILPPFFRRPPAEPELKAGDLDDWALSPPREAAAAGFGGI